MSSTAQDTKAGREAETGNPVLSHTGCHHESLVGPAWLPCIILQLAVHSGWSYSSSLANILTEQHRLPRGKATTSLWAQPVSNGGAVPGCPSVKRALAAHRVKPSHQWLLSVWPATSLGSRLVFLPRGHFMLPFLQGLTQQNRRHARPWKAETQRCHLPSTRPKESPPLTPAMEEGNSIKPPPTRSHYPESPDIPNCRFMGMKRAHPFPSSSSVVSLALLVPGDREQPLHCFPTSHLFCKLFVSKLCPVSITTPCTMHNNTQNSLRWGKDSQSGLLHF